MNYKETSIFLTNNKKIMLSLFSFLDNIKVNREVTSIILEIIDNDMIGYINYKYNVNLFERLYYDIKYNIETYKNALFVENNLNPIFDRIEKIDNELYKEGIIS